MLLPAENRVHISVRLRAGSAPREGRIGEGVTYQTNQCQRFDVFIHSCVKETLGGWGGTLFTCLSGCHLCFNLLLHFSKTNRNPQLSFYAPFPLLSISPLPLSATPVEEFVYWESQLHRDGAPLPCRISYGHVRPCLWGWVTLQTISLPLVALWWWASGGWKCRLQEKGICCFKWKGHCILL